MIKLERLFSKDQYIEVSDEETFDDEIESSKTQIPFNKAFLSLALVEPQRTISFSLDELDRCIMNKADLFNSLDHFKNRHDTRKVNFVDSPNMYSLSTISENSLNSTPSPLMYNSRKLKGSLEVALETISSSLTEETMLLSMNHEGENEVVETKKSVSVTDTVETINFDKSPKPSISPKGDTAVDKEYSSDDELNQQYPKNVFLQFRKLPTSDELVLFEKRQSLDNLSEKSDVVKNDDYDSFQIVDQPTEQSNYPKSILKKKGYEMSGLQSEPITRRHTTVPSQFFGRDIKSVSHLCDSPSRRIFPQKQKKHSAPARVPLTKLKSSLNINRKVLSSLQRTKSDNFSEELIELLVKQAELLNEDIKHTLFVNALKYGGIAVVAILVTCASLRYCIKYKKCD